MLCDACQHAGAYFFPLMKGEYKILPARTGESAV